MELNRKPTHPGEILYEEYIKPNCYSIREFSRQIRFDHAYLSLIIRGERPISAKLALKLSYHIQTTPEFWLNLQMQVDLYNARKGK